MQSVTHFLCCIVPQLSPTNPIYYSVSIQIEGKKKKEKKSLYA